MSCTDDKTELPKPTLATPIRFADTGAERTRRASEQRQLTALQARGDTVYQYLVETAARICQTPLAGFILIHGDTLRFKAVVGLPSLPADLPADSAPCLQQIKDNPELVTVMQDACADEQTHSPLMAVGQPLRFLAAARLADASDSLIGLIWVADAVTRQLTPVQLRSLELLARQTTLLMKKRV
ncbi:MAG: hypothetical protein LBE78_05590 [Burkholderiaceae bacterium]|jgi:hypothetical protein|nr:hypothetical protein [Burkholderiaceae bacterium]